MSDANQLLDNRLLSIAIYAVDTKCLLSHQIETIAIAVIQLRAQAAKIEALEKASWWQPIETAPKETEVFIGRFIDGEFEFGRSELFYEQANEFAGETFSGWVWSEDECSSSITELPTHWMPLPKPPISGEIT